MPRRARKSRFKFQRQFENDFNGFSTFFLNHFLYFNSGELKFGRETLAFSVNSLTEFDKF